MNARATALRTSVAAMFVALTLLAAYLPSIPGSAFKFRGFPLLLGGILVGPRTGFAIGCLTDLINFALHPDGPFFPGFILTQALTAMLPGLLSWKADLLAASPWISEQQTTRPAHPVKVYLRLLGVFALTKLVTVPLVAFFSARFVKGTPFDLELKYHAGIQLVHLPIYALLALLVLQSLARTDLYARILKARR